MELLHSYAASPSDILRKARIPNAVSYLFTALKIAAPVAVITAFVSEYFGGSQNGLGYGITSNAAISKTAASWGYVVGACLLGLAFYLAAVLLERLVAIFEIHESSRSTNQQARGASPGGATA